MDDTFFNATNPRTNPRLNYEQHGNSKEACDSRLKENKSGIQGHYCDEIRKLNREIQKLDEWLKPYEVQYMHRKKELNDWYSKYAKEYNFKRERIEEKIIIKQRSLEKLGDL